jgi:hypothetical protein
MTLLHELGHAFNLLFGPGSSKIEWDGDGAAPGTSKRNTDLIFDKCFNQ